MSKMAKQLHGCSAEILLASLYKEEKAAEKDD